MKKHVKSGVIVKEYITDSETAEVIEENIVKHTYLAGSKEQFFLGYVTMLSLFQNIGSPSIKIYAYLLERYNAGVMIGINKAVKNQMKSHLGFTGDSTINNALSELVKVGLLYKQDGVFGAFFINPRHAFKGSTRDRDCMLKSVIELKYEEKKPKPIKFEPIILDNVITQDTIDQSKLDNLNENFNTTISLKTMKEANKVADLLDWEKH